MNTVDITVPQTVAVPLEPIVEAVRVALTPVDVRSILEELVDEYDFSMTFEQVMADSFDISDHSSDIDDIVERWFDYNFDIGNYSSDIEDIVNDAIDAKGFGDIDPSEFPTLDQVAALTARISELESRVERLVSALQNAVRAYSVDGGAQ